MPQMRKGRTVFCTHTHASKHSHTQTHTIHTPGANVSLMHVHAVARGLIGYINTNTSLERKEGKGVFFAICSPYYKEDNTVTSIWRLVSTVVVSIMKDDMVYALKCPAARCSSEAVHAL